MRIGVTRRNYSLKRVSYGLPVGVTFFHPFRIPGPTYSYVLPGLTADMYHVWNGVVYGMKPWVTSFEGFFPRLPASDTEGIKRQIDRLASPQCKAILALSDYALHVAKKRDLPPEVVDKMRVFYGGVGAAPVQRKRSGVLRLCMVGHEFFRKGGKAVLMAMDRLDAHLTVISEVRGGDYVTRATDDDVLRAKTILSNHPCITWHERLPHDKVLEVMANSDAALLPTLDDTLGWSAIEAMACGLPVIGTDVCAMPEIIQDGVNGFTIKIAEGKKWAGFWDRPRTLQSTYEVIADGIIDAVGRIRLDEMSRAAVKHVEDRFSPTKQARELMSIYHGSTV